MRPRRKFIFCRVFSLQVELLLCVFFFIFFFVFVPPVLAKKNLESRQGGQLVLSTTSDPKSFNDILAKETSTTMVTNYIFEGLTRTDTVTLKEKPHLAKGWKVSSDGLTWTFYLRKNIFWSDGHSFTADDVVFTFNDLIYNSEIPSSARDIFTIDGKIFKVEKIDNYTVKFTLPVRFAPFLRGMCQAILPKHILEDAVKGGRFNSTWGIDTDPRRVVGTGPYKLIEYRPGERLVFERNPLYWRKSARGERLPFIEKIIYLIVQNADIAMLKFLDGELDYHSMRGTDYPFLKRQEKKGNFRVFDVGATFGSNFLVFNQNAGKNPETKKTFVDPVKLSWFKNLKFRKAVAHTIDKKKMIDILMNGLGYYQDSSMSPTAGFFYNPNVVQYEYDLEKARAILESAGFIDRNGDGVREDQKGNDLKFNIYTNSGSVERMQIAAIIRHDLEQIGMKVNFLSLEFNSLVGKLTSNFDWDAIVIGLTGGVEPHFGKNVWASNGELHMWSPRQEKPATDWEKRIDEIFNSAVQELSEKKRKVLYDDFQVIVSEQLPVIYTVLESNIFAVRDKFENLKPNSYGGAFHNLEELYLKKEYR